MSEALADYATSKAIVASKKRGRKPRANAAAKPKKKVRLTLFLIVQVLSLLYTCAEQEGARGQPKRDS